MFAAYQFRCVTFPINCHVDSLLGHHLLPPSILFLHYPEFLSRHGLRVAILPPITRITSAQCSHAVCRPQILLIVAKKYIHTTQLFNDLFYGVPFLTLSVRILSRLSVRMDPLIALGSKVGERVNS